MYEKPVAEKEPEKEIIVQIFHADKRSFIMYEKPVAEKNLKKS